MVLLSLTVFGWRIFPFTHFNCISFEFLAKMAIYTKWRMRARAGPPHSFRIGILSFSHRTNKTILSRSIFFVFKKKSKLDILEWFGHPKKWLKFNQSINQQIVNFYFIQKLRKLLWDNIVLMIQCEKLRNRRQNECVGPARAYLDEFCPRNAWKTADFARNWIFFIFLFNWP
jgi:hypothetical protein